MLKQNVLFMSAFIDDEYDGIGSLYYENNNLKYHGEFKNGKYDGYGCLYSYN
jgi:antitoxin component YwqK of YwqJK toxin-antitoxin module